MRSGPQFLTEVRAAVRELVSGSLLRIDRIDLYLGGNPVSNQPAIAFRILLEEPDFSIPKLKKVLERHLDLSLRLDRRRSHGSSSEKLASLAAAIAAALMTRELDVETRGGSRSLPDGSAESWLELSLGAPAGLALKAGLAAVMAAIGNELRPGGPADRHIATAKEACAGSRPDEMSSYLIAGARARDLPYASLGRSRRTWQFGWGNRARVFRGSASDEDSLIGFGTAKTKNVAKWMFRELGIPTPRWEELAPGEDPERSQAVIGWPCVVKPVDSTGGEGVTSNIRTLAELKAAVALARQPADRHLLIEAHLPGADHRLMIVRGEMIAAVRRDPPMIVGDGRSSIRQLIDRFNQARTGRAEDTGFLSPVRVDERLRLRLLHHGISFETVLDDGVGFVVCTAANRAEGGSATSVTESVHPQVRLWAEQLAQTVGLSIAGIDYVTEDISKDPFEIGGGFIEINATPGLRVIAAAGMKKADIGNVLLGDGIGRIPVDLVLTNEARIDDVVAGLEHTESSAIAWGKGGQIGTSRMDVHGASAISIVWMLLRHRRVKRCTIVWTPDELTQYGLPVDAVTTTTILDAKLDEEWLSLLKRLSAELSFSEKAVDVGLSASAIV